MAQKTRWETWIDLAAIVALFVAAVLIAGPAGDFPLNDDWSFATAARRLALDHVWRPTGWTSMPLITHAGWGALACTVAGDCSATILRWATIVAAAATLVGVYAIGQQGGLDRGRRLLFVGLVGANPLFFAMSLTFMTDITFLAFAAAATAFYVRALRTDAMASVAAAAAISVAAVLCRQVALFLPLGFAIALIWRGPWRAWRTWAMAAAPLVVTAAALILFNRWMAWTGTTPSFYLAASDELVATLKQPAVLIKSAILNPLKFLLYIGLFCLPLLLTRSGQDAPKLVRRLAMLAGAGLALIATAYCVISGPMPVGVNILTSSGIGPFNAAPYPPNLLSGAQPTGALAVAWWIVTAAAILGGGLLVYRAVVGGLGFFIVNSPAERPRRAIDIFVLAGAAAYIAPLVIAGFFDRYLLPLMLLAPLLGAAGSAKLGRRAAITCAIVIAAVAVIAVTWTHDYMAWNRARWAAINGLVARGVAASDINGGFEFYGKACFDKVPECPIQRFLGWEHYERTFVVGFSPLPNYRIVNSSPYDTWLPRRERQMLVMQRETAVPAGPQ